MYVPVSMEAAIALSKLNPKYIFDDDELYYVIEDYNTKVEVDNCITHYSYSKGDKIDYMDWHHVPDDLLVRAYDLYRVIDYIEDEYSIVIDYRKDYDTLRYYPVLSRGKEILVSMPDGYESKRECYNTAIMEAIKWLTDGAGEH